MLSSQHWEAMEGFVSGKGHDWIENPGSLGFQGEGGSEVWGK